MIKKGNTFAFDLDFGERSEKVYGKVLSDLIKGKHECKAERDRWIETGNMFIEFESRGKKSGISTTNSDHWVVSFYKENHLCFTITLPIKEAKALARKYYLRNKIVPGGDENTSKGVLVPIWEIFNMENYK